MDSTYTKVSRWSTEMDRILTGIAMEDNGTPNWSEVARRMRLMGYEVTNNSCRTRYAYVCDPLLDNSPLTDEELEFIRKHAHLSAATVREMVRDKFARLRSYLVISAEMRRWQKGGRRPYAKRKFEAITTEVTSPKTLSSSDELELDPVESVDDENVPSSAEALVAPQLPVSSHSAQRGRPPQPIPESYYNDPVIELPRALIIPAVGDDMLTRWRKIEARDFIMKAYGLEY